jgi:hypothetical protein
VGTDYLSSITAIHTWHTDAFSLAPLKCSTESERKYAPRVLALVDNHHWLLVTLLLCNAAVRLCYVRCRNIMACSSCTCAVSRLQKLFQSSWTI